jgi:hypothetical protein
VTIRCERGRFPVQRCGLYNIPSAGPGLSILSHPIDPDILNDAQMLPLLLAFIIVITEDPRIAHPDALPFHGGAH